MNQHWNCKSTLDWMPVELGAVDDEKFVRLIDRHGHQGPVILFVLMCKIYQNGYYLQWDDSVVAMVRQRAQCGKELLDSVLNTCFEQNLFSYDAFMQQNVLTSYEIQQRFLGQMRLLRRKSTLTEHAVDEQNKLLVQAIVDSPVVETSDSKKEEEEVHSATELRSSATELMQVKEKEIETEKKEEESFPHTPFKEVERKEKEKEKEKFVDDDVVVKTTMSPKNFGISTIRKGLGVSTIQPMSQDELKAARLRTHVSELRGDEVWREVMCMRFEISAADLDRYIDTFELECRCNGSLHNDANDCKRHCVNWLHKRREIEQKEKLNQQKHTVYASNFQRNNPRRRGFDPSLLTPADYEGKF